MAIFDSGIFDANIFDTAIVFAYPTGVVATGQVGVANVDTRARAILTGVSAIASVGSVTIEGDASFSVTGIGAVSAVSGVDAAAGSIALISSPEMSGLVGDVTVELVLRVFVTGLQASGLTSPVLVWASIAPSQSPAYSPAVPDQDPNWVTVAA